MELFFQVIHKLLRFELVKVPYFQQLFCLQIEILIKMDIRHFFRSALFSLSNHVQWMKDYVNIFLLDNYENNVFNVRVNFSYILF